ncbi:MAG: hypothetical protein ACRDTT_15165 [Pseudonocardiaceae bacterium]
MDERRSQSVDSILDWTREERDRQLRHFDGLDTKAGLLLGFSGALAGLARTHGIVADIGRYAAVFSAFLALLAFWPRGVDVLDLRALRALYVGSEPEFTKLRVLDTQISIAENVAAVTQLKARLVKLSMGSLVAAALIIVVGLGVD